MIHHTLLAKMVANIEEPTTNEIATIVDISPKIDVKFRKGEYIIKMANTGTDENNIESCLETAMKNIVFLAFKNGTKIKKNKNNCRYVTGTD